MLKHVPILLHAKSLFGNRDSLEEPWITWNCTKFDIDRYDHWEITARDL